MAADVIVNGVDVYRLDENAGVWRRIPDPATAAAMGVDYDNLDHEPEIPTPTGDDYQSAGSPGGNPAVVVNGGVPPTDITAGDYGGASDISSLSQTPAGQVILTDAGITPQDVPQLPPTGYDPNYVPSGYGNPGATGDDDNDDIMLLSFRIVNRDASGGVSLAGSVDGEITPQGAWRGFIDTLAYTLPGQAAAARAASGRFMDKVR